MTNISLGQEWVTNVTRADAPENAIIGAHPIHRPEAGEFRELTQDLARTPAAREMVRRRWFSPADASDKMAARGEALLGFLFRGPAARPAFAMFRGRRLNARRDVVEQVATMAWLAHAADAVRNIPSRAFRANGVSPEFLADLVRLSIESDGPKRALETVRAAGIHVIVEDGLPGMSLDGASFHTAELGPVLGMTLRHDRLDNFWFTLLHELGHIALHLAAPSSDVFVDAIDESGDDEEEAEAEADAFAKDALIPRDAWFRSDAYRIGSESSLLALAKHLGVHPAIVAGRIRYERRDFRRFASLVGQGQVRDIIYE
jgi:HTH-type transcriptional regulator / antitoxin HigA